MNIDTSQLADSEFISRFPAEACTEVGWQDDEQGSMQMLAYVVVYVVVSLSALAAVFL